MNLDPPFSRRENISTTHLPLIQCDREYSTQWDAEETEMVGTWSLLIQKFTYNLTRLPDGKPYNQDDIRMSKSKSINNIHITEMT